MNIKDSIRFLMSIWKRHTDKGEYVFLSTKCVKSDKWRDHSFKFQPKLGKRLHGWFQDYCRDSYDLYFCPLPFSRDRRKKSAVVRSKYLWSDLDEVDPRRIDEDIRPNIYWRSSPGRYQALWLIDDILNTREVEKLNKAMTYHLDADKGGWDLTQVLRIPGSYNHKYDEVPEVTLLNYNRQPIATNNFENLTQESKSTHTTPTDDDRPASQLSHEEVMNKYWDVIPDKAKEFLMQEEEPSKGRRSDIIWALENMLYDAGLSPPEIITLVKNSVWNKYKGRHDEDKRLREELKKIISGKSLEKDEGNKSNGKALQFNIDSYYDVAGSMKDDPGWLVKGFWAKESHGIVAGEPKSFKSTLTLDLAVSVASGKPFLGKFIPEKSGDVVVVQSENASWIMKDRLRKIAKEKNLTGSVDRHQNYTIVDFPPELPLHFINQQMFLFNDPGHRKVIEEFIEQVNPELIIFDPLYLMFDGNINSAEDLNPVLNWFLDVKNKYNTGVILIHHWNKAQNSSRGGQKMLGSTTLHGWVESAWYIGVNSGGSSKSNGKINNPEDSPSQITLEREFRAAGSYPKVDIDITMGDLGDPIYKTEASTHKGRGHTTDEETVKEGIKRILDIKTGKVSQRELSDRLGVSRKKLREMIDDLSESGYLNITKKGVKKIKSDD